MLMLNRLIGFWGKRGGAAPPAAVLTKIEDFGSTSNLTTYTFAGRTLHATTEVFIAICGQSLDATALGFVSATMNGGAITIVGQAANGGGHVRILLGYAAPGAATGDIVVTWNKDCTATQYTTFHANPASNTPVDILTGAATTTTSIVLTDLAITSGGFVIAADAGPFVTPYVHTHTWGGIDAIVKNTEAGVPDYVSSYIGVTTETDTTRDVTMATSATADRVGIAGSWL